MVALKPASSASEAALKAAQDKEAEEATKKEKEVEAAPQAAQDKRPSLLGATLEGTKKHGGFPGPF